MDLAHAVKTGRFRANLYYRLNVLPVAIPALHERREDIRRLAEHFITRFHDGYGKKTLGLSDRAMEACMHYSWPGNIRELENVIERGIILTDANESISVPALFPRPPEEPQTDSERVSSDGVLIQPDNGQGSWISQLLGSGLSLDEIEESLMREAMQQAKQNVSGAARLLGLSRPALAYRLKKIGIED
nr:helix-turn-helix domain-containing protein [Pseudomonas sp. phDV1]